MDKQLVEIARKTQYQAVSGRLSPKPDPKAILMVCDDARNITSRFFETILKQVPPPACDSGCHFCCYLMATVSAPEALAIAHHLRQSLAGKALRQLKLKLARSLKKTERLSSLDRIKAGVACPLLSTEGLCTIYENRPLDCLTYHSQDRTACEQKLADPKVVPPMNLQLRALAIGVKAGLGQGIAEAQLEQPALRYELIEALSIALNDPQAMQKYLAGKNIFRPAAIITDQKAGIGYKIKHAPAHLKREANRVLTDSLTDS